MVPGDDARKLLRQQLSRGRFEARLTPPQKTMSGDKVADVL